MLNTRHTVFKVIIFFYIIYIIFIYIKFIEASNHFDGYVIILLKYIFYLLILVTFVYFFKIIKN